MRKYASPAEGKAIPPAGSARILVLDIETAPIKANVWRIFKENVGLNQIDRDWFILSFSAKWLGADNVLYFDQSKAEDMEDDTGLLMKLHDLLDKADIVVAHNGRRFDLKKINARFITQGLLPPSPFKIVDTLEIAKAKFGFTSNRLEHLANALNTEYKKLPHAKYPGFELWKGVMRNERAAWREMRVYNEHDVLALEEIYLKLRVWDDRHPNVNSYSAAEEERCPVCGSVHIQHAGFHYTNAGKYQRIHCLGCGAWSHGRTNLATKEKRKALLAK